MKLEAAENCSGPRPLINGFGGSNCTLDSYTSGDQVWQDQGHWKDEPTHAQEDGVLNRGGKENGPGSPLSREGGNWQPELTNSYLEGVPCWWVLRAGRGGLTQASLWATPMLIRPFPGRHDPNSEHNLSTRVTPPHLILPHFTVQNRRLREGMELI